MQVRYPVTLMFPNAFILSLWFGPPSAYDYQCSYGMYLAWGKMGRGGENSLADDVPVDFDVSIRFYTVVDGKLPIERNGSHCLDRPSHVHGPL